MKHVTGRELLSETEVNDFQMNKKKKFSPFLQTDLILVKT